MLVEAAAVSCARRLRGRAVQQQKEDDTAIDILKYRKGPAWQILENLGVRIYNLRNLPDFGGLVLGCPRAIPKVLNIFPLLHFQGFNDVTIIASQICLYTIATFFNIPALADEVNCRT